MHNIAVAIAVTSPWLQLVQVVFSVFFVLYGVVLEVAVG